MMGRGDQRTFSEGVPMNIEQTLVKKREVCGMEAGCCSQIEQQVKMSWGRKRKLKKASGKTRAIEWRIVASWGWRPEEGMSCKGTQGTVQREEIFFFFNLQIFKIVLLLLNFIVVQAQFSDFSPHHAPPPQPSPSPTLNYVLFFVHVSFIIVSLNPSYFSPHYPLPSPLWVLSVCP